MSDCAGNHRIYVAETIGVEAEGKVYVVLVCTACGDASLKSFDLNGGKPAVMQLGSQQKKTKQE